MADREKEREISHMRNIQHTWPALRFLNLATNEMEGIEDIAAVGSIRHLSQLVIYGNPFASIYLPGMSTRSSPNPEPNPNPTPPPLLLISSGL